MGRHRGRHNPSYWALYAQLTTGPRKLHSLHSFRGSAIATQKRSRALDEYGWHADYHVEEVPPDKLPSVIAKAIAENS